MKKILLCFVLSFSILVGVASADPIAVVDKNTGSITISSEGEYHRGDVVKLVLLKPGFTTEELDNGVVGVEEALAYAKEIVSGKTQFAFPTFTLPQSAPYGNYTAYITYENTTFELVVPYVTNQQFSQLLGDSEKADEFCWLITNFSDLSGISASDLARVRQLDEAGKKYFASRYILGKGYESLPEADFQAAFSSQLTAYLRERETIAIAAFNQASSSLESEKALTDYNDIFGIDFSDSQWLGSLTEEDKQAVYERIGTCNITAVTQVAELVKQQIALRAIEVGPWGMEETILQNYQTLLGLDLSVLNHVSDKTAVYKAIVGEKFLTGAELQNKLNSFAGGTNVIVPGPVIVGGGGGGGGGGGAISILPNTAEKPQGNPTIPVVQQQFRDLENVSWAKNAVYHLTQKGVLNGKSEAYFCPSDFVTRAEFAKMLVLAFELKNAESDSGFYDVAGDFWAKPYIDTAFANNIITGYNKSFLPGNHITREDIAVMIYRAMSSPSVEKATGFSDDADISEYAKSAVAYLYDNGIVSGQGNNSFAPKANATRAEAAVMIYNTIGK